MRTFSERIAGQPLDEIALELSHDFDAQADLALCRRRMDALALELEGLSDASALEQTRALGDLTRDFTRSPEFYYTPANSYLTRVLNGGPAIPITLAALWVGLGRRAGISVDGIGFPGHFLVRVGGHVIVDVFERGRVLSMNDLRTFAQRLPEPPTNLQSLLEPSNQEQAARRMLLNVRRACMAVGDEARALLACDRLIELAPAPLLRRMRGLHAMRLGAMEAAAADLRAYIEARPNSPHDAEVKEALRLCAVESQRSN